MGRRKLERDLGLKVNRDKTRIVQMEREGSSLDFLGLRCGTNGICRKALEVFEYSAGQESRGATAGEIRVRTASGYKEPLTEVVAEVNTLLRGWSNYFRYGYPRKVFRGINYFVRCRFRRFLRSRSQRRCKPFRAGESLYAGLQRYGLRYL